MCVFTQNNNKNKNLCFKKKIKITNQKKKVLKKHDADQ